MTHVWHPKRAETPFSPASTFKIPNALIAMDAEVVKDLNEVIPYRGTKEFMKEWEREINLRDATKLSNVAIFHQVARRIGLERMRAKLVAFDYGNEENRQRSSTSPLNLKTNQSPPPMKTTIKDNVLRIEIPLHAPGRSATGKILTVATSNGSQITNARINGLPMIVSVNAYIKPER